MKHSGEGVPDSLENCVGISQIWVKRRNPTNWSERNPTLTITKLKAEEEGEAVPCGCSPVIRKE